MSRPPPRRADRKVPRFKNNVRGLPNIRDAVLASETAFVAAVRPALLRTWNQIGHDIVDACDLDNELAIECCIDADRLLTNGDDAEAHRLVREHPDPVRVLAKHIQLV